MHLLQNDKNMNEEIVGKINRLRTTKGLSQTCMADKLNITRSAYQKLESGKSYAWAKYLDKLMDVLEISLQELFSDIGHKVINQNHYREDIIGYLELLNRENREIYEKLIASKEEQIAFLKCTLQNLLEKK